MVRYLTAAELVALQLPGLPTDKGALHRLIMREGWRQSPLAREGASGWEYESGLLPVEARAVLAAASAAVTSPVQTSRGRAWDEFQRLGETARAKASQRLAIVAEVETLRAGGMKPSTAVPLVARQHGISASTLWSWLKLVDGTPRSDWLAVLAPQHKGRTATADCDQRAWDFFVADYLRPEKRTLQHCYEDLLLAAAEHGWSPIPALKTLQRRLERQVPAAARTLARDGRDALARQFPHQSRDRSVYRAMQAVNADGHTFDVFVRWEDGTVGRPVMTAVQDLATGMILGYRLAQGENWAAVRHAFADMVERYGIPEEAVLDNGRAFASKWLTGGQKSRFRFKIKAEEPIGVLTGLGIRVHWAQPYHGQAKPIERAFRDLCAEHIAKHPACAGAYSGNNPMNKPANYGSRAMPIADFRAVVASEIARHNAREGRRGNGLNGQSFAAAFARSLAEPGNVVIRATPAQRRLLLTAAEGVTCQRPTGEVQLAGNRYWADELVALVGRKVTVRFDPDDLHAPIAVYTQDGRFVCEAPAIAKTGFRDADAAADHARDKRRWMKGRRDQLESERRLSIDDVAAMLPKLPAPEPAPSPAVVRLVTPATSSVPSSIDQAAAQASFARAVRAMAEDEDNLIPFRAAERG
jgi:transposase InsO family protein